MKYLSIIILFVLANCCQAQNNNSQLGSSSVSQLKWLEGKWLRVNNRPGRTSYETWNTASSTSMDGLGITLMNSDTTFRENLKIIAKDDKLFYVAEVAHNAAPVYFEIEITGKYSFTSHNPDHDFPKQIAYKLDKDRLTATISGDGKSIDFVFQKASPE